MRAVPAYPLLGQFKCSLVFAHSKQLNDSLLVWRKTTHLFDQVSDELHALIQSLEGEDKMRVIPVIRALLNYARYLLLRYQTYSFLS